MRIATARILRVPLVVTAIAGLVVGSVTSAAAKSSPVTKIAFTVSLTSTQRNLTMVGRGGEITYGLNQLDGTATSASGDIGVQIIGNVEYTKGSGPFFGFITLKFASLSTLGLRIEGTATLRKDGTTALKAKLRVIGGNAAFTGATGSGSFTGVRKAALGSPIDIKLTINVRGISN